MAALKGKAPSIREKRASAIAAYYGTVESVLREFNDGGLKQRIRTFSQDTISDIITAIQAINTIQDAGIVIHGPRGCGIIQNHYNIKNGCATQWVVTNIDEEDSILGSDVKLRSTVESLYRQSHLSVIFVVTTSVVAINNDDVASVAQSLTDELGIPVVPVYTDGFKSKLGVSGYDVAAHSIVKYLLPAKVEKNGLVNVLSFRENRESLKELEELLAALGVESNVFPRFSEKEQLVKAGGAQLSFAFTKSDGAYFAKLLEEIYDVPVLEAPAPVGIRGTGKWLAEIAAHFDKKQQAKELAEREGRAAEEALRRYSPQKSRVFLNVEPEYANAMVDLLEKLNAEVVGIQFPYLDITLREQIEPLYLKNPELPLLVGEGQPYEKVSLLKKLDVGVYIGNDAAADSLAVFGIPVLNLQNFPFLGYQGSIRFAEAFHRLLQYGGFAANFKQNEIPPAYQPGWLKKNVGWYIKQEVK